MDKDVRNVSLERGRICHCLSTSSSSSSHPVPSYSSSLAPAVKGRRDDGSLARAQRKERGEEGDESQSSQLVHQTIELSVFPLAKRCLARGRKHWRRSSGRWLGGILYPTPSGWRSACLGAGETTPTHSWHFVRNPPKSVQVFPLRCSAEAHAVRSSPNHRPNTKLHYSRSRRLARSLARSAVFEFKFLSSHVIPPTSLRTEFLSPSHRRRCHSLDLAFTVTGGGAARLGWGLPDSCLCPGYAQSTYLPPNLTRQQYSGLNSFFRLQ